MQSLFNLPIDNWFGNGINYKLVGVIIHIGISSTCGHYTNYFVGNDNQWFFADDEKVKPLYYEIVFFMMLRKKVTPVSLPRVLAQEPFLLLYELCGKEKVHMH